VNVNVNENVNYVKQAAEGERLLRMSADAFHKAAELGERRMNTKLVIELQEAERERRVSEGSIEITEAKIVTEMVIQAAEDERTRRLSEIEGLSLDVENITQLHENLLRRSSIRLAGSKFDSEKTRRVFHLVAEEAANKAERAQTLKLVKELVETERAHRIGAAVFAEASAKAISALDLKKVNELEETERSRRIADGVYAQAAVLATSRRESYLADVAYEAERLEQVDDEAKSDYRGSLLYNTIIPELSLKMEGRERLDNRQLACDLMDLEKERRLTVEEAYLAEADYNRLEARRAAAAAVDTEKAYRLGLVAAADAAEKAAILLNRKLAANLADQEKARRTQHYPSNLGA